MSRWAVIVLGAVLLAGGSGCAMCSSEFDQDYAAYGGSWERYDRTEGRVGSAFQEAGDRVAQGQPRSLDEAPAADGPASQEESMDAPHADASEAPTS